jgi:hypothetical protein
VVCDLEKSNLVNEEAKAHQWAIAPRKKTHCFSVNYYSRPQKTGRQSPARILIFLFQELLRWLESTRLLLPA